MWPFRTRDSYGNLLDRIDALERSMRGIRLEFIEVLDKTQRWMQRSIKRADRESRDVEAHTAALDGTDSPLPGGPDPISARILRERRVPLRRGENE